MFQEPCSLFFLHQQENNNQVKLGLIVKEAQEIRESMDDG